MRTTAGRCSGGRVMPVRTGPGPHSHRLPATATPLEPGNHEDLRNPRITLPPVGCGHRGHNRGGGDRSAWGTHEARGFGEDPSAGPFSVEQLSPVLDSIQAQP